MKNTLSSTATLAWCAGLFDGEGCIHIKKRVAKAPSRQERSPHYALNVKVKMVHKPSIELLAETFGVGTVTSEQPGKLNKRVAWRWNVAAGDAIIVLTLLLPFLVTKRDEALLAIRFADANRRSAFGRQTVPIAVTEIREEFYQDMRSLKLYEWKVAAPV